MKLSKDIKQKIKDILDSEEFMSDLYEGLDPEKREELGQFYTPAKVCIRMLEKYKVESFEDLTLLDPCCGSGNLLIAALIAGVNINNIYGNDYDSVAVKLCRKRLNRACDILGVPHVIDWHIHRGNALDPFCLSEFGPDYKQKLEEHYLEDQYGLFPMLTKEQEEFLKEVE